MLGEQIITKTKDFPEVLSIVMYDSESWLSPAETQRYWQPVRLCAANQVEEGEQ